jgi:hypothetical protein
MEKHLKEIRSWLSWICFWTFCIALSTCSALDKLNRIANSLDKIESRK